MPVAGVYNLGTHRGRDSTSALDYVKKYLVLRDSGFDNPLTILNLSGIPQRNDSGISGTYVTDVSAQMNEENEQVWTVDAVYTLTRQGASVFDTELNTRPRFRYIGERNQVFSDVAYSESGTLDVPVVNTIGEPFIPHPSVTQALLVVRCDKKSNSFSGGDILKHLDSINSGTVTIDNVTYSGGTLLMRNIDPEPFYDDAGSIDYYIVHSEVVYKSDTWIHKIQNAGLRGITADSTSRGRRLMEADVSDNVDPRRATAISRPWRLDSGGAPILDVATPSYFINFRFNPAVDWSGYVSSYMS